jgi:hypothetical protein
LRKRHGNIVIHAPVLSFLETSQNCGGGVNLLLFAPPPS